MASVMAAALLSGSQHPVSIQQSLLFLRLYCSFYWRCFPDPEVSSAKYRYSTLIPKDSQLLQASSNAPLPPKPSLKLRAYLETLYLSFL